MTMKIGEFVVGVIDGTTEAYQTEDAEKLLTEEEFNKLWRLSKIGTWTYFNPEERVIARTVVTETNDGESTGRKATLNHTVIIKFDATIIKDECIYRFDSRAMATPNNFPILNKPMPHPLVQPLPPLKGGEAT
jgi:hypothetical protein